MARASRSNAQRGARQPQGAPAATDNAAQELGRSMNPAAPWAREAVGAWLVYANGFFDMAQTLQQAQVQALQDAASEFETAVDALEDAEDLAAVSAVPGRWLQAQWQHAMNNAWSAGQRLFEIESAWFQQAQAEAAQRVAALASGASSKGVTAGSFMPPAFAALAAGKGPDTEASAMTEPWQQWFAQWQQGIGQLSRQWSEAVKSAQSH